MSKDRLSYRAVGADGDRWPQWVRDLKGKSGVYVIKDHGCDGVAAYVGSSTKGRLYDTLTRHFQTWGRKKQWWRGMRGAGHDPGLVYKRSMSCVAVVICSSERAKIAEAKLIQRLKPRDNLVERPDGGDQEIIPF